MILQADAPAPDKAIIHNNEQFDIQWVTFNVGTADSEPFSDKLEVIYWPELSSAACTDSEGQIVYNSETDETDPTLLQEPAIPANSQGPLMKATVGPFPAGWIKMVVTLGVGQYDAQAPYNCIQIEKGS